MLPKSNFTRSPRYKQRLFSCSTLRFFLAVFGFTAFLFGYHALLSPHTSTVPGEQVLPLVVVEPFGEKKHDVYVPEQFKSKLGTSAEQKAQLPPRARTKAEWKSYQQVYMDTVACTEPDGWFWANDFFTNVGYFREHPRNLYWDHRWVCVQRGYSMEWEKLGGRTINAFPNTFKVTNEKKNYCKHLRNYWTENVDGEDYIPCYSLPEHKDELKKQLELPSAGKRAWTIKPNSNSGSQGVKVLTSKELSDKVDSVTYVQEYIWNPLLVHNHKCDLRVYAFVPSLDPLRVYLAWGSFVRFSSVKWSSAPEDLQNIAMHITGVHLQQQLPEFKQPKHHYDDGKSSTWSLDMLMQHIANERGQKSAKLAWKNLKIAISKTVLAVREPLQQPPCSGCYQVWGVDCLIDSDLKAYVIELNTTPGIERHNPFAGADRLVQAYSDVWNMLQVNPRIETISRTKLLHRLKELNMELGSDSVSTLSDMIHEFYYRGSFDMGWPVITSEFEELERAYPHQIYEMFRKFLHENQDDLSFLFVGEYGFEKGIVEYFEFP